MYTHTHTHTHTHVNTKQKHACILAQTCSQAGKPPGCCTWGGSSSCYVSGGNCYCDSSCVSFNDCCDDIDVSMPMQCGEFNYNADTHHPMIIYPLLCIAPPQLSRSKVQSDLEQELMVRMCIHTHA